ncbi:MAG: hypothetical protein ACMUHB_04785 [Thermoplasmatota archaeon]
MEEEYEEQGKKGFSGWFRSLFHKGENEEAEPEAPHYKRKLLDGRIEKYLDQNMNAYINEYGILTGLDLEAYETRYASLTSRISGMKEYMLNSEARISEMERDVTSIQNAAKTVKKEGK